MPESPLLRHLGRIDYEPTWRAMQAFTAARGADTPDELWLLEHPPVFTLGQAGKREHVLTDVDVPIVHIDRGGQVTYHGPGQVVVYVLVDLKRRGYGVKELVNRLEQAVIDLLAEYGVAARRLVGAPGVYVGLPSPEETSPAPFIPARGLLQRREMGGLAKVAALGLRIRGGCSYHGLALNVDMDLAPFAAINPCGYEGLAVTQTRDLGIARSPSEMGEQLLSYLVEAVMRDKATE